jgi:diaminohydroxyphosphoribosylaminopyrimidine deaminase/5-amino-6-(5-phosphoribosylamino)uracil reductase
VFVGTVDTNPRHREKGIAALREAGIEVVVGVLEDACRRLNAPYFTTMEKGRPLVAAKWAMSLDGKIATASGDSAWISNERSRAHVHELRDRLDAVMVGTGTLRQDDPRLTCRSPEGRDPVRVVIDTRLESSPLARVYASDGTIVVHDREAVSAFAPFAERGAISLAVTTDSDGRVDLQQTLAGLVQHDVMSVMVEGGSALLGSLFDADLVDRVYAFVAPRVIGGADAVTAVAGNGAATIDASRTLRDVETEQFGDDILIVGDF